MLFPYVEAVYFFFRGKKMRFIGSAIARKVKMSHIKNITELCLLVIVLVCLQLIATEKKYLQAVQRTLLSPDDSEQPEKNYTSQLLDPDDPEDARDDIRSTGDFVERVLKQRARIRRHGCQYIKLINKLVESNADLEELMSFHRAIYELKKPANYGEAGSCRPPFLNTSALRTLDKPWNILICLPPKCGTTNWQRAMTVLKMNYPTDSNVKESDIKPEELTAPKLYKELDTFIVSKKEKVRERQIDATFDKILNGRNPFTRLFSAWNDKSRSYLYPNGSLLPNTTKNWAEAHEIEHDFHRRYHPGWGVFEEEGTKPQRGRNVSWPAFVEYVAANPGFEFFFQNKSQTTFKIKGMQ